MTENHIESRVTIKYLKHPTPQSNITYVDFPKDESINCNNIPKNILEEHWKCIDD